MAADTGFIPVRPQPPVKRGSLISVIRTVRDNVIAAWGQEAYERAHIQYRMLLRRILLANDPAIIRHVMLDNWGNYPRDPLGQRILEPGLGNGLLTSSGADWKRQRRMLAPIFSPRRVQAFGPLMVECAAALGNRLHNGAPVDMADAMMHATLDIIARSMFGADADTDVSAVGAAMDAYQVTVRPGVADLIGLPEWFPRPGAAKGRAALAAMDAIINDLIGRRRKAIANGRPAGDDMLGLLLAARDEEGDGTGLNDAEIRDQMATFFLAGHETTATALAWCWYLLAHDTAVESRLHAEIDAVLPGRDPVWGDMEKLPYTRMVIEEAMRLYPPAHSTSRVALADDRIGDLTIKAGTAVIISPWLMHRHKLYWKNPERFDPENFSPTASAARPRFVYLPFGAGPRICIGMGFAMAEAVLILATLARRFRFRMAQGAVVTPIAKITLRPQPGLPMVAQSR
ncbi:cytochrome P450 [Ferrovibrio sp.]|uniref:cytochrome P450 n=1 Tax=Ferrovibrio sp. TaxID=1917215 RepID=UPI0035AE4061